MAVYSRERLGAIQGSKTGIGARDLAEVGGFRQELNTNGLYTYMAYTAEAVTDVGFFLDQGDGLKEGTLIIVYLDDTTEIYKLNGAGTGAVKVTFA